MSYSSSFRTRLAEAAFDELPNQIAIIDTDGVIRATNRAWKTFGVENGAGIGRDMVGEDYLAVCRDADDDEIATAAADGIEAVIDGETSSFSLEYPCHSPEARRWFLLRVREFEFEDEPLVLLTHSDITDRYEAEQAVAERNELLELVAGVLSHDLRNPLSVALGGISLIDGDDEHVAPVRRSLERMQTIIDDALLIARGNDLDDFERVDLGACAQEAWSQVSTEQATLHVSTGTTIAADRSLLAQLFENLFRNAVEHGSTSPQTASADAVEHGSTSSRTQSDDAVEHGSTSNQTVDGDTADGGTNRNSSQADDADTQDPSVTVTVEVRDDGFVVMDDGPGIPRENWEAVFEAGFSTDVDQAGSGLGLLIVREIARAHDWTVAVAEAPDGGAMFVVSGVTFEEEGLGGSRRN